MADQVGVKAADEALDAVGAALVWVLLRALAQGVMSRRTPGLGRVGCGGRRAAR